MTPLTATIMMGLPCSGKSTWIDENCADDLFRVSADAMKEAHPDYDPNNTEVLHEWSVEAAEDMVKRCIKAQTSFVFDSGSINNSYTLRIIMDLARNGYRVGLVHVKTPYKVCLQRNALRERKVPEHAITDKAVIENRQFHKLRPWCDSVTVVDYFTNQHIFIDMDGVIAAQTTLPIINGEIDFVNAEIHKWQSPVQVVINKLNEIHRDKYILSAACNSIAMDEKRGWLANYFPLPADHMFFVNQGKHKAEMLDNLRRKFKLRPQDVLLIDDAHSTLYDVKDRGMNAMHPSEFLATTF